MKHLTKAELEELLKYTQSKRLAERLIFLKSLYDHKTVKEAANTVGRCKATGYLWLKMWNSGSVAALVLTPREGKTPKLSKKQQEELKQLLSGQNWTTRQVKIKIEEAFNVKYSTASVSRLLRRLGMHYAKPYPHDYRRPKDAENSLKKTLDTLEGAGNVLVGFFDECRPQTDANTQRVWSFGRAIVVKDTTHYRANTFGFYAPEGISVISFMENSKKESVCAFLEAVRAGNPDKSILLILDNFRSHRAGLTKQKASELGIILTYLPPYSPDLNPIEQLWRCLKREVSIAFFRTQTEFLTVIEKTYHYLSGKTSFAKDWIQKFMPQQSNQLCY